MDKWIKLRNLVPKFFKHKSMKMSALEAEKNARLDQVAEVEFEAVVSLKNLTLPGVGAVEEERFKGKGLKLGAKFCLSPTDEEVNKMVAAAQEAAKRAEKRFQESEASIEDGLKGLVGPSTRVELTDVHDAFLINWMKKLGGEMEFKIGSKATDEDIDAIRDYMMLHSLFRPDLLLKRDVVFKLNKFGQVKRVVKSTKPA